MVTDPIADLLTRIRNAIQAKHIEVIIPYSKTKEEIMKIFQKENYIEGYEIKDEGKKNLVIKLIKNKKFTLERKSKPGQRIYLKKEQIHLTYHGYGIGIFSTNQGVLTDSEAKKKGLGGEFICEIF